MLYVAGILSPDGGRRVVCTESIENYQCHICLGERCFIVPGYLVPDPIPHLYWSAVVLATDHHIVKYIRGINDPGHPDGVMFRGYLHRLKHGDVGERASFRRFAGGVFLP